MSPLRATVQPMCVQIAEKATTLPAVGWATITGLPPGPVAEIAPPTGTSATRARVLLPLELAVGEPVLLPPQPARTAPPSAVPAPATRIRRRENPSVVSSG